VSGIPIALVRKEDHSRAMLIENAINQVDGGGPVSRIILPGCRIDFVETVEDPS